MTPKPKEDVPQGFINLVHKSMSNAGKSLRSVALDAGLDPATLSRILAGHQGLPTNDVILNLARALDIHPPERLLYEACRVPDPKMVPLLRATGELNQADRKKVLDLARKLAKERESKRKRR